MTVLEPNYLVVGADGLVGNALLILLEKTGAKVTGTSRRSTETGARGRLFLDLADVDVKVFRPSGYSVAFLCAAITSMAACEDDPAGTERINVLNTVALAKNLLAAGTRIVFLSSNTVFDGTTNWPNEDAPYSPSCEYGRQKAEAERRLLSLSTSAVPVAIVRLSKVLELGLGMAAEFRRHLAVGEACPAFDDLIMCPISLGYTTNALLAVARSGMPGVFHVSGKEEMSYAGFACRLAMYLGADSSLVRPCSSVTSSVRVVFRPAHPGLGMQQTHNWLGIDPEPTDHLMTALTSKKLGVAALS